MKTKKTGIVAGILAMGVVLGAGSLYAVEEKAEKTKICHFNDSSDVKGKVLSVSENAIKAHMEHGDPKVFVAYKDGSCEKYVSKQEMLRR